MPIRWDTRNKRWRFEFDRVIEGRRQRTSRLLPKGWTQAQADAFDRRESGRLYAVATGVERSSPLIEDAVLHYLRDKTGLKSYRATVENLHAISWAYVGKTFADLPAVAQLVNSTRQGLRPGVILSDATVHNRLALLKAACRWGWRKHGMGEADPTVRMILPAVRNERHVYISRAQMVPLARACRKHATRVLIRAAFYTGMRVGELERVEVAGDALHLADTKNGSRRSVPVHPKLRTCLRYLPVKTPRTTLEKDFQRARAACGMPHLHLHDLRHSTASEMVNAGVEWRAAGFGTVLRVLWH